MSGEHSFTTRRFIAPDVGTIDLDPEGGDVANSVGVSFEGGSILPTGSVKTSGVIEDFGVSQYDDLGKSLSDYYSGDVGRASRVSSGVDQWQYALEIQESSDAHPKIHTVDPVGVAFTRGNRSRVWARYGRSISTLHDDVSVMFGLSDPDNHYFVSIAGSDRKIRLGKFSGGSEIFNTASYFFDETEFHEIEVRWGTDDVLEAEVFDAGGSSVSDIVSFEDSEYVGADGIGFRTYAAGGTTLSGYFAGWRTV